MLVCGLLAKTLYGAPDAAWLYSLIRARLFDTIPFAGDLPETSEALAILRSWSEANQAGLRTSAIDGLNEDYMRLFVGPGRLLAAPWQSVYTNKDRAVFQMESASVKNWYLRFDLALASEYNEPADHVGLEFAFVAHLAELILAAAAIRDGEEVKRLIAAQRGFLGQHVSRWVPRWASDVAQHARTDLYRGLALLARSTIVETNSFFLISSDEPPRTGAFRIEQGERR